MFTSQSFTSLDSIYTTFEGINQHTLFELTGNGDLLPAYTFPDLIFIEQNAIPSVHYYDCTCKQCRAIHFPCDDMACTYCESVRYLLAQKYNTITTQDNAVRGTIIDYATWNSLSDDITYDNDDMVWKHCIGCDKIHNGIELAENNGYHSSECENENGIPYCADCGEVEVDYDGEYCITCQQEQHNDSLPYNMGQVLDPDQYHETTEAWINPNGDLHYVPCYNVYGIGHHETAQAMGYGGTGSMESMGFLHVSTYYNESFPFRNEPRNITDAQIDTAMLLCDTHGWSYPDFIVEWLEEHNQESENSTLDIKPMQNLSYSWLTMPRKERDKWYPLSGD